MLKILLFLIGFRLLDPKIVHLGPKIIKIGSEMAILAILPIFVSINRKCTNFEGFFAEKVYQMAYISRENLHVRQL